MKFCLSEMKEKKNIWSCSRFTFGEVRKLASILFWSGYQRESERVERTSPGVGIAMVFLLPCVIFPLRGVLTCLILCTTFLFVSILLWNFCPYPQKKSDTWHMTTAAWELDGFIFCLSFSNRFMLNPPHAWR